MKYPSKRDFARYELQRPDFRRRRWRYWMSKHAIGSGEWWADVSREDERQTAEDRMVHNLMGSILEKRARLILPLSRCSGKTVRFTRLLPLEAK